MISDIVMESNTNNPGQFIFRVDDGVSNKTCTPNTGKCICLTPLHTVVLNRGEK